MSIDFLAGCVGGAAGVVVGHPLDTVKVRIQTQCIRTPLYSGTADCLKKIVTKEGFRGLYRGLTSPMYGVAAVNALTFGIQGNVRRLMRDPDSLRSQFTAGMIAGGCQAVVVSPMELVKSQVQVQSDTVGMRSRLYTSPWDCFRQLMRRDGLRCGLMRGYWITVVREVPAFGIYFGTYELLTTGLMGDGRKSLSSMLFAGGMAGVASWVFTYPIDVVKTRIQTDGMTGVRQYMGYADCARSAFRTEGWRAFFRGVNSASVRAFPTNAVTLATVSVILEQWHSRAPLEQEQYDRPEQLFAPPTVSPPLPERRRRLQPGCVCPPQVAVTSLTLEIESADGRDAARRRRTTIQLQQPSSMEQLRRALDRELAALQAQLPDSLAPSAVPVSAQRADSPSQQLVLQQQQQQQETSGDSLKQLEDLLRNSGNCECRKVRRETTIVTRIVEYDVQDDVSKILETASV